MGSGYGSGTVDHSGEARGLAYNLNLIRKYGTDKDKDYSRGSGMKGGRPLSNVFYENLKKAQKKMR